MKRETKAQKEETMLSIVSCTAAVRVVYVIIMSTDIFRVASCFEQYTHTQQTCNIICRRRRRLPALFGKFGKCAAATKELNLVCENVKN